MGVVFGSCQENTLLMKILLLHILAICSSYYGSPFFNDLAEIGSLLGSSPSMLQMISTGGGGGPTIAGPDLAALDDSPFVGPAVTTIPAVTTAPMVTTVMNPPMMAATILPVIFAAAVIKALILERLKDNPTYPSHLDKETDFQYPHPHHGFLKRRKNNQN